MSLTSTGLKRFTEELVASSHLWRQLVRHDDDARVYELIWEDEAVNAWVICWAEDQDTGYHDHDASAAAIAVIDGEVREDRLRLDGSPCSRVVRAGETFTVPPASIHRVLHSGTAPSVTIHAYSPPLTRTGAYRVGPEGELLRDLLTIEEELRAQEAVAA